MHPNIEGAHPNLSVTETLIHFLSEPILFPIARSEKRHAILMVSGPGHAGKLCDRIEQFQECGALKLDSAKRNCVSSALFPSLFLSLE